MNDAAGSAHSTLLAGLDDYEIVVAQKNDVGIQRAERRLDEVIRSEEIGGRVSSSINSAMTEKTRNVEKVRGEAQRFARMLALHKKNPSLYKSRQIQDTIQSIFEGNVETFYLPPRKNKTLYLELKAAGIKDEL